MTAQGRALFSETYQDARRRLLEVATRMDAKVVTSILVDHLGREGEVLATDMVWLGDEAPRAVVIITSGLHGVEGFAGSAAQLNLALQLERAPPPAGVAVALIHAVNPYGFSHLRRTNEDNVDLNRNFIDFSGPLPTAPDYESLHGGLIAETWAGPAREASDHAFDRDWARLGEQGYHEAVFQGQHDNPEGLFFGGLAPSWSNRTLNALLAELPPAVDLVAHIDLHTGLGPKGFGEVVYPLDTGSDLARQAEHWYRDVGIQMIGADGSSVAPIRGCLNEAVLRGRARAVSVTLEFGTVPLYQLLQTLRADNIAHHVRLDGPELAAVKAALLDAFRPDDDDWMRDVLARCDEVFACALDRAAEHAGRGAAHGVT